MTAPEVGAVMPFKPNGDVHTLLVRRMASFSPFSSRNPDDIPGDDVKVTEARAYISIELSSSEHVYNEAATPSLFARSPPTPGGSD